MLCVRKCGEQSSHMLTTHAWSLFCSPRAVFALGILCALALIGYGRLLVPATSDLSVTAAVVVLALYATIGWVAPKAIQAKWPRILSVTMVLGIFGGLVFACEVLLEYVLLPENNAGMGFIEFGLVLFVYALAAAHTAYRFRSVRAGIIAAGATAMISSLIWFLAVLTAFYAFYGSHRQVLVFQAEGNYEDFARSGMTDFRAFIMEDFLGAGFYHLLLGPLIAATLGAIAGFMATLCQLIAGRRR
jgi:hypothetical protein